MSVPGLRLGLALAATTAIALATAAAVNGGGPAGAPAPTPRVIADRLALVRGGIGTPLAPGAVVDVASDLTLAVSFGPEPASRHGRILRLAVLRAGTAVTEASVAMTAHMVTMDHGSFAAVAIHAADGAYEIMLPFVMPGEWRLALHVASGGTSGEVELDVEVYD